MNDSNVATEYIAAQEGWKHQTLQVLNNTITEAAPHMSVSIKWGVPVWSNAKAVCAISAFKDHVKINFLNGASLEDSDKLFNAGLESKSHRSIDFYEGDTVDSGALMRLVEQAVAQK